MRIKILEQDKNLYRSIFKCTEENKFYIYAHFRFSNDKIFYIGRGCSHRGTTLHNRNRHWKNTLNKHGGYIKILKHELTSQESNEAEIYFIKLFGLNSLTNISEGGLNGLAGKKNHMYGVRLFGSANGNFGNTSSKNPLSIPIICLTEDGSFVKEYNSATDAATIDRFSPSTITACCKGKRQHHRGFIFIYKSNYNPNKKYFIVRGVTSKRKVQCLDLEGNFIKIYSSTSETSVDGFDPKNVQSVARGRKKTHKGRIFKYV